MTSQATFANTNWYEKGAEKALDFLFETLDEEQHYPFFKYLMQNYPDLDIEWLEIFEDFRESLFKEEKIDEVLLFVDWYSNKFQEDYSNRYEFIEGDLCDYYIFKKDWENVKKRIPIIEQNPASGIDTLTTRLLYQLIYNGQTGMAVEFAKSVWQPINTSDKLFGFPAYPFIKTIYSSKLQQCYEAWLQNEPFDEKKLHDESIEMGYDEDPTLFNQVLDTLKSELDHEKIYKSIQRKDDEHMLLLYIHFLKFMYHKYNFPFAFSDLMWSFVATTKIFGKLKGTENYFYIEGKILDKHIIEKYDSFLSSNELEVFGKVWGLQYLVHFLHQVQLLSDDHYLKMTENNIYFRNVMSRIASRNLWQMSFVHDWPRTDNSAEDPSERAFFKSTRNLNSIEAHEAFEQYYSTSTKPDWVEKNKKIRHHNNPLLQGSEPYIKAESQPARNDLCPCGSGKKFKKCCLNKPKNARNF